MEQLIELLTQIQEIAGVVIDTLTEAAGGMGESGEGEAPEGPPEGEAPGEEAPEGGPPNGPPPEEK